MTHQDLKDLLPLYVVGGLETEAVTEVERHLAEECKTCVAELRQWREVAGYLPLGVTPEGPSSRVKDRLMARVRAEATNKVVPLPVRTRRWRSTWVTLPLAAAAAVLFVLSGIRYQKALELAAQRDAQEGTVSALLRQERERLASRENELQRLTGSLQEQQRAVAEKEQHIARLENALAQQQQVATTREREVARLRTALAEQQRALIQAQQASQRIAEVETTYRQQIARLQQELERGREQLVARQQEFQALQAAVAQQRAQVQAQTQEVEQLRAAVARQRGVIEVLTAPGLQVRSLQRAKLGVQTSGHVLWNEQRKLWAFYAFNMPQPPSGKEYQVWFMTEKEGPVSAGLFSPDENGTGQVLASPPSKLFGRITATAVTLEPAGGLPKPSGEMYLRGSL